MNYKLIEADAVNCGVRKFEEFDEKWCAEGAGESSTTKVCD